MDNLVNELKYTLPQAVVKTDEDKGVITVQERSILVKIKINHDKIEDVIVNKQPVISDYLQALFLGTVYTIVSRYSWKK